MNDSQNKPLIIIDGYGFIFRAYHVQPPLTSPSGQSVGAIYGLTSMLLKLIADFKPEHAVIVLDSGGKTFRHEVYSSYKAHRPVLSADLIDQLKLVEKVAEVLNFRHLSKKGFEADDIIATLADKVSKEGKEAIIISSDKDLLQLADDYVKIYDPVKSKFILEKDIVEKFGVPASKIRDMLALVGDKSDNVPGVAGIGPKTAAQLINEYGDLNQILNSIETIKNPRWQKLLKDNIEAAKISWQLVGLDKNVHIKEDIENFILIPPHKDKISNFLDEYGFKSLNKRIENLWQLKIANTQIPIPDRRKANLLNLNLKNIDDINSLIDRIQNIGKVAIFYQNINSQIKIILNTGDNLLYHLDYDNSTDSKDLFSYSNRNTLNHELSLQLDKLFADKAIKKITYNLKSFLHLLNKSPNCGEVESFDDLMLMDYMLSAGNKIRDLPAIIENYVNVSTENNEEHTARFIECYDLLLAKLVEDKTLHLYNSIDLPLCYILYDMEKAGIKIDTNYLKQLSCDLESRIRDIEQKIYISAGETFNVSSPKQLGIVLFEKMKLPFAKLSGKSKAYSTGMDVLEKLHTEGHEIARLILDYRHLSKLKNTYTDSLPQQIQGSSDRIHTTFLQCATTTGRLSSINPNLQNIPIRTEEGNKIRAAFVAAKGKKLISADYSQIELRILSHVADIKPLKQAFKENRDIHTQTAGQIFGIPPEQVNAETRRSAKAINFGIIYGISAFGLAKQLNISRYDANLYIERYFKEFSGIKDYMDHTVAYAGQHGFIPNMMGRKCFLPYINSKDAIMRAFNERAAINAPMQSLASDIVKIAMIRVHRALLANNMKTRMILQIHDELLFEAPEEEIEQASGMIKSIMESAYILDVKMDTKVSSGNNWQEL